MCSNPYDAVQLHVHTYYSPLDGQGNPDEMAQEAKRLNMKALAITDHGTLSGIFHMQNACDAVGIKSIPGCEFYIERERDGKNGHQLVLAKNEQGLTNLYELMMRSHQNFYKKPRIKKSDLFELHEGLVVTSTCLGSDINQYLMHGEYSKAKLLAKEYQAVFGEDFYMEIQPNGIPEQHIVNQGAVRIGEELRIRTVATNDVHYCFESDCYPHEVLLAMQVKKKMDDEKRFKFSTNDFWLKSGEEMFTTLTEFGVPETVAIQALEETGRVADKCNVRINKGHYLPKYYDVPKGETERSLLVKESTKGIYSRGLASEKKIIQDIQNEINVIDGEGYSGYFLIVQDYVQSAKRRGEVVGDGRGSGAGSKVAYVTGITEIPPHEYDLLFERFLAPGREPDSIESST